MIAILGGTFDPIHKGHLYIATQVANHFTCNKILLIPCHQSPHRPSPFATPYDRGMMVSLAAASNPLFEFSNIELNRPAPSYMIDTLRLLKKKYPDEELALIIGSDAYTHFNKWLEWENILSLARLIVVNRRGFAPQNDIITPSKIVFLDIVPCDISSTAIRERINKGDAISGLVPKVVEEYILKKRLYLT